MRGACFREDALEESSRRGLACAARDRHDAQLSQARAPCVGDEPERATSGRDAQKTESGRKCGKRRCVGCSFDNCKCGTRVGGGEHKRMAVEGFALQRDEAGTGEFATGVGCERGRLARGTSQDLAAGREDE